jgi:hypothetical protein
MLATQHDAGFFRAAQRIAMTFQILTIFLISLAWGTVAARMATRKRRNSFGWFALGACFWFLPLLFLRTLRKLPRQQLDIAVFPSTSFPDTSLSNSRFL